MVNWETRNGELLWCGTWTARGTPGPAMGCEARADGTSVPAGVIDTVHDVR